MRMKMLKLKALRFKKREWTLVLILLIIVGVFFAEKSTTAFFVNSRSLDGEISAAEKRLFNLKLLLKQTNQLNAEYDKLTAHAKDAPYSDNLLQDIENIARKSNVSILNIKPSLAKDEGAFKTYSIKIESQEDLAVFSRFLYALTEGLKRVGVERVQVSVQKENEPPRIFLSLNAVAFKE
jgi:hypothetical protein